MMLETELSINDLIETNDCRNNLKKEEIDKICHNIKIKQTAKYFLENLVFSKRTELYGNNRPGDAAPLK